MFDEKDFEFITLATVAATAPERNDDANILDAMLFELLGEAVRVENSRVIDGFIKSAYSITYTMFSENVARCVIKEFKGKVLEGLFS